VRRRAVECEQNKSRPRALSEIAYYQSPGLRKALVRDKCEFSENEAAHSLKGGAQYS
jgi:hypothetical protein